MIWIAWFIPPLALAAGWLLWTRLPAAVDEQDDPLETAFAALLGGVLMAGCLALLLAELGVMRPGVTAAVLAAVCVALRLLPRRSPPAVPALRADVLAAAIVTVLSVSTLAPASEEVLGGRDEGVYTSIAAWAAEHGTIRIRSEALASLTDEARPVFQSGVLVPGFYVGDAARGEVFPQFLHLHPIYMALGFWLGGVRVALLVPPLYGLLTHLATFLLVRRLLGPWPAVVASLVLGLNLAHIWILRTPFSEGAAQFAAAATLWCLARAAATNGMRWGVLGGLAMGAGFLIRVDAPLLLLALIPALAVLHASSIRPVAWATSAFLPLTLAFAGWGILHGRLYSTPYAAVMNHYLVPLWLVAGALFVPYVISLVFRRQVRALAGRAYRRGMWWWALAALFVTAAFVFGMWIRPGLSPWMYQGRRALIESTMVRVTWYFSVTGMVMALAGVLVLLWRWLVDRRLEWVPFLAVFIAVSLAYFWNPRVSFDHPWAMRRFAPVILPGIAVAVAAAVAWLWNLRVRWHTAARAAALLLLAVVLVHEVRLTLPFWNFREKAGSLEQLTDVARHIPRDAVLLYTTGLEVWLATPLAFLWNHDILPVLGRPRGDLGEDEVVRLFEAQVTEWLKDGRSVMYLTRDEGHWRYLTHHLRWEPVASFRFVVNRAGLHVKNPPPGPTVRVDTYNLVRITRPPGPPPPCAGLSLDAAGPVAGRTQGFHAVESGSAGRYRWTYPNSRVMFRACESRGAGSPSTLRVRALCTRATADDPCRVQVTINGVAAGDLGLTAKWEDHELAIPAAALNGPGSAVDVRFAGPSFRPARTGRIRDRRVLSFMVKEVALEGGRAPVRFGIRSAS